MLFSFRRRPSPHRETMDRMYAEIVAAVRNRAFYLHYAVPDSFEGRFELLALHAGLVLRRLNGAEAPGPAVAQDLVDTVFANLETDLREAGVGDITVPKRMKKLAEAFLGRSKAYDDALPCGGEALGDAVARNVYGRHGEAHAVEVARMTRYVRALADGLGAAPLAACLHGPFPFPDPLSIPA